MRATGRRFAIPALLALALGAVATAPGAAGEPRSIEASPAGSMAIAPRVAVRAVGPVGMTVSDMDRAAEFYSTVLTFQKVSDVEVAGADYEHLEGVFGLRMRVVRMKLGDESIELTGRHRGEPGLLP